MHIETFELERNQSLYENTVRFNLTESGIHPYTLRELLSEEQQQEVLDLRLGYGQTNGDPALRQTIADLYPGCGPDDILVTNGSAEANFVAFWSLLDPGDEVAMMLPNYQLLYGLTRSLGCTVKPFHLREELNWAPDLDELASQMSSKTRVIALCNPNNPTGSILSSDDMQRIVALAREYDCYLLADEIYVGSELDGRETPSFMGLYDKTIVVSGLAKSLSHPGLRIGWLAGPREVIEGAWHHHDYTSISTGIISQYAANIILQPAKRREVLDRGRALLRTNVPVVEQWAAAHGDRFHMIAPRAGGMAFMRYNFDINSSELVTRLREDKSVLLVAGDWFGMDRYLRLGIGGNTDELVEGLELVNEFLLELEGG
ncbi:MAG: aminotransferase class I/II-fold pyridoxal phosphate-dependent enzyme [Pseudomonadales bacterium]|nr:aminotransferase class I/II-fold pyridoxal phosphate-dependent enzyme [Pseudomonadales bacterium]MCP5189939.1 aminotransferase class I/II-fold pyridoxal phosphate-dependent enzyme [Pseudomonadales bacterium]